MQRVGAAGVFGQRPVVKVRNQVLVEHDILQNRAEPLGGAVDFRLGFPRQANGLGVAATFEVEDAVRAPAMLVVADEDA